MTNSNDMPLAAKPIDRAAHHRTDADWLVAAASREDVLIALLSKGDPLVDKHGNTVWLGPEALNLSSTPPLFLGKDKSGTPVFAVTADEGFTVEGSLIEGLGTVREFRAAAAVMSDMDANCISTARSLFLWHASHGFCAKCGGKNTMVDAGWKAKCSACDTEHFPRTDPVAIMLAVKDGKCLLGRQAFWPQGFMSALAGFCEPGETIEQAAARELEEEAGIICDPAAAEYIACQPWPFPSSLMVGLILPAQTDEITIDKNELESAKWIPKSEAREILAGTHSELFCPPKMAIAHHLLKVWAGRDD